MIVWHMNNCLAHLSLSFTVITMRINEQQMQSVRLVNIYAALQHSAAQTSQACTEMQLHSQPHTRLDVLTQTKPPELLVKMGRWLNGVSGPSLESILPAVLLMVAHRLGWEMQGVSRIKTWDRKKKKQVQKACWCHLFRKTFQHF